LFLSTLQDIFNKFDLNNNKVLCWKEFEAFCQVTGIKISESEYVENICSADNYAV